MIHKHSWGPQNFANTRNSVIKKHKESYFKMSPHRREADCPTVATLLGACKEFKLDEGQTYTRQAGTNLQITKLM
jgi:hypothetical protein